jgi:hypothetical protein
MFLQRAGMGSVRRHAIRRLPLHRVVLDDHARLPGRFFGRLTAAILARLRA